MRKTKNTSHLSFIYSNVLNYLIYALKHIHKSFYIKELDYVGILVWIRILKSKLVKMIHKFIKNSVRLLTIINSTYNLH